MEISVICTVYNEGEQIELLLNSLLNQTKRPDEIVIVDGGSTDGTQQILKNYAKEYDFLHTVVEDGVNIAEGRNIAVKEATYDVILGIDGGCEADEAWVERMAEKFRAGAAAVAGMFKPKSTNLFEFVQGKVVCSSYTAEALEKGERAPSSRSIGFKKSVWKEAGGYPEDVYTGEDTKFNARIRKAGYTFVPAPRAVVYWAMRPTKKSLASQFFEYGRGDARAKNFFSHPSTLNSVPKNLLLIGSIWLAVICGLAGLLYHASLTLGALTAVLPFFYHVDSLFDAFREEGLIVFGVWLEVAGIKIFSYFAGFNYELLSL